MYNPKHLQAIREKLLSSDTEGAIRLSKKYAEEEMNKASVIKDATKKFMAGKLEAEEFRTLCDQHEKKIITELLKEARK